MKLNKISCRDCGEPTWNRTERCGICREIWRKNMNIAKPYSDTLPIVTQSNCSECDKEAVTFINGVCNTCTSKKDSKDEINWPKHYNAGKIQPIDAIEDWKLDFRLANAVKYIARHEHKGNAKKDLEKAIWYIQRYIDKELTKDENNG